MSETEAVETTDEEQVDAGDSTESTDSTDSAEEEAEAQEDPTAGLRKALAAERKARREAERKARDLEHARADADKEPAEQALEKARREAREEAQSAFNQRLVQAELKAALAGKVTNPSLALRVIDTSEIDVTGDGEIDSQSVTDAIEAALAQYPELAPVQKRFDGTADQGARGKTARPAQLTREDLKSMSPEQIVKAEAEGRLASLLGG